MKNYDYFIIKSKNIVEFINQVNGKGKVEGVIDNIYQPTNYLYKYIRKKKGKYVEMRLSNNVVKKILIYQKLINQNYLLLVTTC